MKQVLVILIFMLFSGCSSSSKSTLKPAAITSVKPQWLENKTLIGNNFAVGFSKPVFGGVQAQRQNALHDAKEKLSHKIKSIVSSKKKQNINIFGENFELDSVQNIEAFNEIILSDIKIYDTYINLSNELYILIGFSNNHIDISVKTLKQFDKTKLQSSQCYNNDILNSIETKSKMYREKPIWFYTQESYESIGIAKKLDDGFYMQKKRAIMVAKSNLIKKTASYSSSKIMLMQMLKHGEEAVILDSYSEHKSFENVKDIKLQDIWLDTKTCEVYVLLKSDFI